MRCYHASFSIAAALVLSAAISALDVSSAVGQQTGVNIPNPFAKQALDIQDVDSCKGLLGLCESWNANNKIDMAYDTIRYYILHCYEQADAGRTFGDLRGAAGNKLKTPAGNIEVRNLLFQALHERSDDIWFCDDVYDMAMTFNDDTRAAMTILKYLIENPRCSVYHDGYGQAYADARNADFQIWRGTAGPNDVYDSTLPSMHDLGLDSLLAFASVAHYDEPSSEIIVNAGISPNPGEGAYTVSLNTAREAYVHIEVFDLLGNKLEAGFAGTFEPGSHIVPLDLGHVPSGTYYLRIYTANNEVRTIKIVKE